MQMYFFGKAIAEFIRLDDLFKLCLWEIRKDLFQPLFPNHRLQVWRGFEEKLLASLVCEERTELVLACSSDPEQSQESITTTVKVSGYTLTL